MSGLVKEIIGKIIKWVLILLALLLLVKFAAIPLINNAILFKQQNELEKIVLPDSTTLADTGSLCGNIQEYHEDKKSEITFAYDEENKNMTYLSTIVIKSELSLKKLQEYYDDYTVAVQTSANFELVNNGDIRYSKLANIDNFANYYVVYSFVKADTGSIWTFDRRANAIEKSEDNSSDSE